MPMIIAAMIIAMVLGFSLLVSVWFGGAEFLSLTVVGGFERVQGIEQRVFNGFPHSFGLPLGLLVVIVGDIDCSV